MANNTINTIFIGTSAEGISILSAIYEDPMYMITSVITQPDRPAGRKRELSPTPIKEHAEKLGIQVHTPETDIALVKIAEKENPDLVVVIAYGRFLPKEFLEIPAHKCINIHYSLLPQLRGAVPVQKALLDGLTETGITVQIMEPAMDTGPILAQASVKIEPDETTPTLKQKVIPLAKDTLMKTLPKWIAGKITPKKQDESEATYCYMKDISKDSAQIQWSTMEPEYIERMIRALLPWPIAWTFLPGGRRLKIFKAKVETLPALANKDPGTIAVVDNAAYIKTKEHSVGIKLLQVQPEGKTKMEGHSFAAGNRNLT